MAVTRKSSDRQQRRLPPPATTVAGREKQLIALAMKAAEKQLLEGTASAQVITHFLKLGTTLADLEKEKLIRENKLLSAKEEELKSRKTNQELMRDALKAMQSYTGLRETTEMDPEDYEE